MTRFYFRQLRDACQNAVPSLTGNFELLDPLVGTACQARMCVNAMAKLPVVCVDVVVGGCSLLGTIPRVIRTGLASHSSSRTWRAVTGELVALDLGGRLALSAGFRSGRVITNQLRNVVLSAVAILRMLERSDFGDPGSC